jgi:hypothetical protein
MEAVFVSSFIRKGKINIDNCSRKKDMQPAKIIDKDGITNG